MNYPEHEKLHKVKEKTQAVGEFMDWLLNERGIILGEWHSGRIDDTLCPIHIRFEELIAEFFGIDENKLEAEKQAMLKELRDAQG